MTAFKLKKKESEDDGVRRVAHGRAEDAVKLLREEEADPVEAVHEARKDLKKLRATLKLVRPVLGDDTYRRENGRFRDVGRALSDVRDAQVRAQTVDALAERFADEAPPGGWWAVRAQMGAGDVPDNGELESLRDRTAAEIERGDVAVDDWPLETDGFDLVRSGLKRAYARARKRYREARDDPSDEALHEWRKRSKDLWYQLRLVRRAWPEVMQATADEAHELSDRLGDDHDLVALIAHLDEVDPALLTREQLDHMRDLIDRRREELQKEAFAYGERLFAERPKRFVKRLEIYWAAKKL
jgi:CHAD domain-containing protein